MRWKTSVDRDALGRGRGLCRRDSLVDRVSSHVVVAAVVVVHSHGGGGVRTRRVSWSLCQCAREDIERQGTVERGCRSGGVIIRNIVARKVIVLQLEPKELFLAFKFHCRVCLFVFLVVDFASLLDPWQGRGRKRTTRS